MKKLSILFVLSLGVILMSSGKNPQAQSKEKPKSPLIGTTWRMVKNMIGNTNPDRLMEFRKDMTFEGWLTNGQGYNSGTYCIVDGKTFTTIHSGASTVNKYSYTIQNDTLHFYGDYMQDNKPMPVDEMWVKIAERPQSIIPSMLEGNWLKTDGSNEWKLGIHDSLIICDNDFWSDFNIQPIGKGYCIKLHKAGQDKTLYLKPAKDGNLYFGTNPKEMELMSRNLTVKKGYVIKDDTDFTLPVFKQDSATFKGYIENYHPSKGKTGMMYVDNVVTGRQSPYLITINSNGTFEGKCPLIHPLPVYFRLPGTYGYVFLEPGKTTLKYVSSEDLYWRYKSRADYNKREQKSLFMGDGARLNADLQAMDSIYYFDYVKTQSKILDMNAETYKAYCFDALKKEQATMQQYMAKNPICKKAETIFRLYLSHRTYVNILSYDIFRESAYRSKNNVPREQRDIPLKPEVIAPEYYSFIHEDELNNPLSLMTNSYYILVNRIQYANCIYPTQNATYVLFSDSIRAKNIKLTDREQQLLDKLIQCTDFEKVNAILKQDSVTTKELFVDKYGSILQSVSPNAYAILRDKNYQKYFGLKGGLMKELMFAQTMYGSMEAMNRGFTNENLQEIRQKIKTPFVADYLIQLSAQREAEIARIKEENKSKSGYTINETPKTEGDKVFDAIMQKYKGKVVFVDFWATWCGPCREGIKKMKPMKEELKDKDVVFVYLTNETSPLDTWNLMIPDIKGEHYRVNKDEWNYLSSRFNISGIPHYTLVDKKGTVVKDGIYFASEEGVFKNLIEEYLK